MNEFAISVSGGTSVRFLTAGKYCDRDIVVTAEGIGEDIPQYDGPSEITPSRQEQILSTAGKYLAEDIKVNKIPEQYGLITYNQDRIITIT